MILIHCVCATFCFPILWDRIELLRIRESRTYLISSIGKSASHPKLSCYVIVLQITSDIFNAMLVECYFLRYANFLNVEKNKKFGSLTLIQSMFQGLGVPESLNCFDWNICYRILNPKLVNLHPEADWQSRAPTSFRSTIFPHSFMGFFEME